MSATQLPIMLGAPMWGHASWKPDFFPAKTPSKEYLSLYARYYSSVEGNTTFYAEPSIEKIVDWSQQVEVPFKFCFKVPRFITHELGLIKGLQAFDRFTATLQPLIEQNKLGRLMLQLPPHFSFQQLNGLRLLLEQYAVTLPLAVEVRHNDFYNKGKSEQLLNRLLIEHEVDRVMMDTRPVHSDKLDPTHPTYAAIKDAQLKKPKFPVHILATGHNPIVRYVGRMVLKDNVEFIKSWLPYFKQWLTEGKQPYLFIHTANNVGIHDLAELWLTLLTEALGYRPFKKRIVLNAGIEQSVQQTSLF